MSSQNTLPLSLDQLQNMDGQSVRYGRTNEYFVVSLHHPDFGECIINTDGYYLPLGLAAERGVYECHCSVSKKR